MNGKKEAFSPFAQVMPFSRKRPTDFPQHNLQERRGKNLAISYQT